MGLYETSDHSKQLKLVSEAEVPRGYGSSHSTVNIHVFNSQDRDIMQIYFFPEKQGIFLPVK